MQRGRINGPLVQVPSIALLGMTAAPLLPSRQPGGRPACDSPRWAASATHQRRAGRVVAPTARIDTWYSRYSWLLW